MGRPITYTANIRGVVTAIEQAKTNIEQAKQDGFKQIANAAFGQVGNKYIVKGNYAKPSSSGKSLTYTTPPGANIEVKKTVIFNKKTKFRVTKLVPMFVKGKFVSRSGNYERLMNDLACKQYANGVNILGGVKVDIQKDYIRVYADTESEVYKLEKMKQLGRTAIAPITKSFRSVVNIWKKVKIKMGS